MKKLLTFAALGLFCVSGMAQEKKEGFEFTTVKANPVTSVKNQSRAGTCWCYSSLASPFSFCSLGPVASALLSCIWPARRVPRHLQGTVLAAERASASPSGPNFFLNYPLNWL